MAEAAVAAGAPDGVVQWVAEPSIPLVNALMTDERTDVIVATGGTAMVRAAYRSGNPAIGVGPGNVPVLVDRTADLQRAAQRIVDSKAFDNSILCTNESVLVVEDAVADRLLQHMQHVGAYLLTPAERDQVRATVFPDGGFDTRLVGKDAAYIADKAGIRVGPRTRVLLAPFDLPVPEEPLAHEKLLPVLGVLRVPSAARGIEAACAILRIGGAGHSAAIHSTDAATVLAYGAAVRVLRVSVNVGNSLGGSGIETNLAPSMTIGTGYFGRSSVGENLEPKHLVNWTRLAYNADAKETMPDFGGMQPWRVPDGPVPAVPRRVQRVGSWRRPGDGSRRAGHRTGERAARGDPPAHRRRAPRDRARVTMAAELRSFIFIDQLQPQTMCYLGTWVKGSLPRSDMAAQVIEVAPGLDIEPLTDVALKHAEVRAGMLVVERQYGYLEIHGPTAQVRAAGAAVLDALGAGERTRPVRRCWPARSSRCSTRSTRSWSTATRSGRWRCRASRCSCWRCSRRRTPSSRRTRRRRRRGSRSSTTG